MEQNEKTILLVEDDLILRQELARALSEEGYTILQAEDGVEGLNKALDNHPHLILLDIVMPKMNGLDMLSSLRQDPWGENAQVTMLTNISDPDTIAQAVQRSASDYIVKSSSTLSEIVAMVKEKLESSSKKPVQFPGN